MYYESDISDGRQFLKQHWCIIISGINCYTNFPIFIALCKGHVVNDSNYILYYEL